jgi:hypothetical protein
MAVGETAAGRPLSQRWTGSGWKTIAAPAPSPLGGEGAGLNDVSCSSTTACTAIGSNVFDVAEAEGFDFDDHPFAETWNGATWKAAGLPVPAGTKGNTLSSVACAGPARCWTAGVTLRIAAQQVPLIEHGG